MWLLWFACTPPVVEPIVDGRGGGAGYWPPHSATALRGAVDASLGGIELDVHLTLDEVPIIADSSVISSPTCTTPNGPLAQPLVVAQVPWAELEDHVLCGGEPDPDHPNALLVEEPLLTLDGALAELREQDATTLRVHLHVPESDTEPAAAARAVLERWQEADLPNHLVVATDTIRSTQAFEAESRARGLALTTILRLHDELLTPSATQLTSLLRSRWSTTDPLAMAQRSSADGVAMSWRAIGSSLLRRAERLDIEVHAMTVNDPTKLRELSDRPLHGILSDYPGTVPTPR
ncbi:MAG: hypothetical protein KTR31_06185 [Myxococcales bacterium]|nr:hypothetical protein [Myxococcales bacterium]